jgi:NADH-quinone oxidoreductase E subunit
MKEPMKEPIREIEELKARYPNPRSAVLPALYLAQKEHGWLSRKALCDVAQALNVPESEVRATATFYAMFHKEPVGRHVIQMCTNVSCMILGAEKLVDLLKTRYGLEPGGTSVDGRFTLVIMECIGACGTAPAMLVDTDFYENLTETGLEEILGKYE